jgi:argininosuccinate lyase
MAHAQQQAQCGLITNRSQVGIIAPLQQSLKEVEDGPDSGQGVGVVAVVAVATD